MSGHHRTPAASSNKSPHFSTAVARASLLDGHLTFEHPASWREQHFEIVSSFSTLLTYLSPLTLKDPCTRSTSGMDCNGLAAMLPDGTLPPDSVLVDWSAGGFPAPSDQPAVAHPNTTIAGRSASVITQRPGQCQPIGADETITAEIDRQIGGHNVFAVTVCLRGPHLDPLREDALAMLASTRVV